MIAAAQSNLDGVYVTLALAMVAGVLWELWRNRP